MNLWAIGSMLGSTQTVDMEMTRKNEFGRICVAALNPLLIPSHLDVLIGDHYFELEFEVERKGTDENGEEANFDWKGDAEGEDEGEGSEDGLLQDDPDMIREIKRRKNDSEVKEKEDSSTEYRQEEQGWTDKESWKDKVQKMSEMEFDLFLKEKAEEIMDRAVDKTLEVLTDQVMTDQNENNEGESSWEEEEGTDELKKRAAIPETVMTPTRVSPRLANSGDEHILTKTEKMAARKNLELKEGNYETEVSFHFPLDNVICNVSQLGVRLGESEKEKERVVQEILTVQKRDIDLPVEVDNQDESNLNSDKEEEREEIESSEIQNLCGELLEEVFDDDFSYMVFYSKMGNHKSCAKSRKRKTCKVRLPKVNIDMVSK